MKLGIFGGTFDPIHNGHLSIAEEAASIMGLDEVWFVPTGEPWLKAGTKVSPSVHRIAMVHLALEMHPFKVSSIEVDRSGPSYTVDTLVALGEKVAKEDSLFFILGMDSLADLHRWHQPQRLFELCTLVAVSRPEHPSINMTHLSPFLETRGQVSTSVAPDISGHIVLVNGPSIEISGAEIRQRVARDLPITNWVPEKVETYIYQQGLYREDGVE